MSAELYLAEGGKAADAGRERALAELIAHPELGGAWMIDWRGATAGYVALTICYSLEFHGRFGLLDELFVAAEWRGRGIGGETLAFIDRECHARGLSAVRLEVAHSNLHARELYASRGYRVERRELMTKWL